MDVGTHMTARERWNHRHGEALERGEPAAPPADWLLEHARLLEAQPRGRALDLACGLGRNAMHLAALGFDVLAVDVSDVAVDHVALLAAARGASVRAQRLELGRDPFPTGPFEVVVAAFFLERRVLGDMESALAPGGLLLLDTFLADPAATSGPRDPRHVLREGELAAAFGRLDVLDLREGRPTPGERARARLVARRR